MFIQSGFRPVESSTAGVEAAGRGESGGPFRLPAPPRRSPRIADLRDLRRYADLRRIRDEAIHDVIRARARVLPMEDRAALEAVLLHGHHVNHIAAVAHKPARQMRVHIRRLLLRVLSPEFACVQAHSSAWGAARRSVGVSIFVRGVSMRQTAQNLKLPLHTVRRHAEAVRALTDHTRPDAPKAVRP